MLSYHAVVLTGATLCPVSIPRDKAVRAMTCSTLCVGNLAASGLVYLNLTSSSKSLLTFGEEIVCPFLDIHPIGYKAVFPVFTVGLFVVVLDVVEVNLANGERERLDVLLLLCGHIDSVNGSG